MQVFPINRNRVGLVCAAALAGLGAAVIWTWLAGVGELLAFGPQLKPMSPGAALLSVLVGVALYFYYRDAHRPLIFWLTVGVGGLLVVASGLVCLRFALGWGSPVEQWLAAGAARLGNFPVGQISLSCGVILLAGGLALLLRLPGWRPLRWIALGLAGLVLLAGLGVLVSYVAGMQWIASASLNRISLSGGVAFILLGGALLLGQEPAKRTGAVTTTLLAVAGLAVVIGVFGALGLRVLQRQERAVANRLLRSVSDLKVEEIVNWRRERLDDAKTVGAAPMVGHDVQVFLAHPESAGARAVVLRWLNLLRAGGRYAAIEVFDTTGVRRLSLPDSGPGPDLAARAQVLAAGQTRDVVVQDLHRAMNPADVDLDLAVAVWEADEPVGVLRLVIDPRQFFYRVLQALPLPQQSAEAALFRVEGDAVVALSEIRGQPNAVLNFRSPLTPTSRRPAVLAALGQLGELDGVDERNVPVLAATRKIPDTPWLLAIQVQAAEIYAPINRHAWLMLSLTVLMTALSGILTELFWERKRAVLAERVEYLMNHANDAILIHDEYLHILEANARALEMYGYSLAELRALPSGVLLRAPTARANFYEQTDPLFLHEQAIYETLHQRKDGTPLPIEISSRVVISAGKRYVFSILRDLTLRKAQEQKILQLNRYYNTLSEINQAIVRVHSRKDLFRVVCQLAAEHGGFKATWIGWVNRETHAVVTAAAAGEARELFDRVRLSADDRPEGRGPIGTCLRTGQPAVSNNIASDPNLAAVHEFCAAYGLRAVAAMPVRFHGEVAGAFTVFAGEPEAFHQEEINLLLEIATDLSFALDTLDMDAQRQRAENELFLSRERYRSVFENMLDGYYSLQLVEVNGQVQDAIYLEVNPAIEQITGLKSLVGKKMSEAIPGIFKMNPEILEHYVRVARTGKSERHEKYIPDYKKWLGLLICSLGKDQVCVFVEDITTRRTSEERLRQALEAARAIAWEENLLTGEVYEIGDVGTIFGRQTGYRHANQTACRADIHPDDCGRIDETLRTATPANSRYELEYRVCPPGGGVRWVSCTGNYEFDSTGRLVCVRGIARDVTAAHHLEEERDIMIRVLSLINSPRDLRTLVGDTTKLLQDWLGCDAVGIRLRVGDDYPYYETRGFPTQFVELEKQLCQRDTGGQPVRDAAGRPVWECLCGSVLSNRFDPTQPFFTACGSFWTNSLTDLLACLPAAAQPDWFRGRCHRDGYESMALVACRAGSTVIGLLQINDKRKNQFTAERIAVLERLADSLAVGIAHRQSEQALHEKHTLLRTLMDTLPHEVFVKDATGHYLICNAAHLKVAGLPDEAAIIGKTVFDTAPADMAQRCHAADLRVLRDGESILNQEELITYAGGEQHWQVTSKLPLRSPAGAIIGLVAVSRDVTDRKTAELELRTKHALLRTLMDTIPDEVFVKDCTGRYLICNAAHLKAAGLPDEAAIIGKTVFETAHADVALQCHANDLRVLRDGESIINQEELLEDATGQRHWHLTSKLPLRSEAGAVIGLVAVSRDIERRKRSEEELADTNRQLALALTQLREAQQQLVAQERLRALGQMASGIAHDFNNALTPILGFADLLLQHPELIANRDKLLHYIRLIHLSAQDAAQIVRRLHEFYRRRRSGEVFLPLQLNSLVHDTIELTTPRWRQQMQAAGITITIQTDLGEIPVIHGNEAELRDALTSLIFHAVDSLPQGGTVIIRTAVDGNQVRLEVADNGVGMSAATRQHCFEPFYTAEGEHGAGLALALVHGIIRRHEGEVTVESTAGVGTTFTIHLPRNISQHVLSLPTGAEPPPGNAHILLVDDEPQLREVLLEFLRIDNHHVELAAAGAEALEKFRPGKFDLVITDKAMPGMNGEQLAAEIKRQSPSTPVVLLTGFGMFMQADELPAGVDLILSKPIGLGELRAALGRVLHKPTKAGA